MRCDLESQIRGVLKTFGPGIGKAPSRLVKRAREIVADELAAKPELASLVGSLLAMRARVVERIGGLDGRLRARAKTTLVCRRLITVPGGGPITALAIWASIDDQARFARSRDVGAYFGLTPRRYASGGLKSIRTGGIGVRQGTRSQVSQPRVHAAPSTRVPSTSRWSSRGIRTVPEFMGGHDVRLLNAGDQRRNAWADSYIGCSGSRPAIAVAASSEASAAASSSAVYGAAASCGTHT